MQEIKASGVIEHHTNNHANVERKYLTASLICKTTDEQAAINSELREAARSHVETWEWKNGGIKPHLEQMNVVTLRTMVRVFHSASLKITEQCCRKTSDSEELLDLTWNCSTKRGKEFPGIDNYKAHANIRKYMDMPALGCTVPPTFYCAVWEEYAAAELYRKEVAKGGANLLSEYFRDVDESGYCPGDQYEGGDLYDPCITYRDADLVLAINLEKATLSEGKGRPKQSELKRYQMPRNMIVRSWLRNIEKSSTTYSGNL